MVADGTQLSQLDAKNACIIIHYGEFRHSSFITPLRDEYNNADATLINLNDPNDPNNGNNNSNDTCNDPFPPKFTIINKKLSKLESG